MHFALTALTAVTCSHSPALTHPLRKEWCPGSLEHAYYFPLRMTPLPHARCSIVLQVLSVLAKVDDWQFDAFELNEVSFLHRVREALRC